MVEEFVRTIARMPGYSSDGRATQVEQNVQGNFYWLGKVAYEGSGPANYRDGCASISLKKAFKVSGKNLDE